VASSVRDFYDGLAAEYHLVYGDHWDDAVARQGEVLDGLVREALGGPVDVLDCSCGIGTQAIGLALRGHRVVGTDISERSLKRARAEAARLGAEASFSVADFRDLDGVDGPFDVVLSCDNALPHLLDEAELAGALRAMRSKLRSGGVLIISIRDYEKERPPAPPPYLVAGPPRRLVVRLHDWDAPDSPYYTVRFFFITETDDGWELTHHSGRYRALPRAQLTAAAVGAGFEDVVWHEAADVGYHQPILTARALRPPRPLSAGPSRSARPGQ
jgi:glycine/sarcosine N-methyltransferase